MLARTGLYSPADHRFVGLAAVALSDYRARNPIAASLAGDDRFDARLPDYSADGAAEQVRALNRHLLALDAIDPISLSSGNAIDHEILRNHLTLRVLRLGMLAEPTWNPLWWSPAMALEPLFGRPEPPVRAIIARLRDLPEYLDTARNTLAELPRAHVELSLAELDALPGWLGEAVRDLAAREPAARRELVAAEEALQPHLVEYRRWLAGRLAHAARDPRLGPRRYGEVFELIMGRGASYREVRRAAEAELAELGERLRSLSARYLGRGMATRRLVPTAMETIARRYAVADAGALVGTAARSVAAVRAFVLDRDLVTVPDIPIEVVAMPEVRSGRAAAFSEIRTLPGLPGSRVRIGLMGPDKGWSPARRASYLREYNALMLDALMAHQAIPGHVLQTAHARRLPTPTAVRHVFPDQVFSEGWAVYAQAQLARHGFPGSATDPDPTAFAIQELKLRMRGVANALLDIGFHTGELDEPAARRLLATEAMAEEGEFVVKWRRVQTTAGILSAYFVGQRSIGRLVAEVRRLNPGLSERQAHDWVLMHGAVPPGALWDMVGVR